MYIARDHESPDATLIATGSEVSLCLDFAETHAVRVISMPSWELAKSSDSLIEASGLSVSVEAGVTLGWAEFADKHVGIDRFGSSAPGNVAMENLGMNHGSIQKALS